MAALGMLAACLCACGRSNPGPEPLEAGTPGSPDASASTPLELIDPGSICVIYRDDAEYRSLPAELQPALSTAGRMSNAILRPRSGYEAITDSIAGHYGLGIHSQVYYGRVLLAGFSLPEGTDGDALLADLRSTYADWVSSAEYSLLYAPAFSPDDPEYTASSDDSGGQWNLKHMHIEAAWEHTLGDPGLLLAVVDTGVNMTHTEFGPALKDPAVLFPEANCDIANDDQSIEDHHGHGTFITGQLVAESDNSEAIAGAAPGISLFPVKISEDGGNETLERIVEGCMLAYSLGAKVVSMSWGGGGNEAMQAMTEQMAADEVLLVCSAGNFGNQFVTYPGAYPDAMAVGNSLPDESRFVSSSYGPALNVVAPGWDLTSLAHDDDNALSENGTGTSYATPLVSAAAALLWSVRPELTLAEMRGLLETSGPDASGFGEGVQVRRLDFAELFDNAVNPSVRIIPPERLVQSGSMPLKFKLRGEPDELEVYLDGELEGHPVAPDYSHNLSLSALPGGLHEVEVRADFGGEFSSDILWIVVAGDPLQFPQAEHFSEDFGFCSPLDLSQYDPAYVGVLAQHDYTGIEEQLSSFGKAGWYRYLKPDTEVPQYQLQIGLDGYGRYEVDGIITQPMLVPESDNPTLALEHRSNVSEVLLRILVSDDLGLSWQDLLTPEGELPSLGGFILPHTRLELDLKPYAGQPVVVMFLLAAEEGSNAQWTDFDWGWWLDVICFGEDGWLDLPVAELSDPQSLVFGGVPGSMTLGVSPANDNGLALAHWWLDFPAFHVEQPPDLRVTVSGTGPHGYIFDLSEGHDNGNVQALLHLIVTDQHGNVSDELEIPAWQYNLPGDVNADGLIDDADNSALRDVSRGILPWTPFADCNWDGSIDERDNAVIAYSWGG